MLPRGGPKIFLAPLRTQIVPSPLNKSPRRPLHAIVCICDYYYYYLKDNPSFNEIGVGAPSRRNVSMG